MGTPSSAAMRSRSTFVALCLLFVCSGACGLTYQVLWLRLLSLVFGVTVHAASTVLAAFMAGLALGSVLAERLAKRGDPLRVFAALEAGIAVSALATPALLGAAASLYRPLTAVAGDSLGVLTLARFAASFAVLLVPTVLMGATLPVLSRAELVRGSGARLGTLYAVNTTGALAGALATGYVLIGGLGIQRTFFLAASLNLLVAVTAWWLSRRAPQPVVAVPGTEGAVPGTGSTASASVVPAGALSANLVLTAMAISGLAALALEIVWFRILVQFLPATSYAFTTMLATVLGGIALGSAAASRALTRPRDLSGALALTLGTTSVVVLASLAVLGATYGAGWRTSGLTQGSMAAILPAAILMGVAFPIALALWARPEGGTATARPVGTMYAANVVGGIAGAVLGGFVLLPWLGSRVALIVCAALYLATAVWLLLATRRRVAALALIALFVAAARVVPDPFTAALARRHGDRKSVV